MITKRTSSKTICNSYIIDEDGCALIIDPGQDGVVQDELERRGWKPEYILLTHEHFDHIEDLEALRSRYEVPVVACSICSERIGDPKLNLSVIEDILSYYKTGIIAEERSPRFSCRPAEITYGDTYEMEWRGHRFSFIRIPGHSPGSVLITMDDAYVFTGDYMLLGDETTLRLRGGDPEAYENVALPIIGKIPDGIRVCPGHGPSSTKGTEQVK